MVSSQDNAEHGDLINTPLMQSLPQLKQQQSYSKQIYAAAELPLALCELSSRTEGLATSRIRAPGSSAGGTAVGK